MSFKKMFVLALVVALSTPLQQSWAYDKATAKSVAQTKRNAVMSDSNSGNNGCHFCAAHAPTCSDSRGKDKCNHWIVCRKRTSTSCSMLSLCATNAILSTCY